VAQTKTATSAYARRQRTWFRREPADLRPRRLPISKSSCAPSQPSSDALRCSPLCALLSPLCSQPWRLRRTNVSLHIDLLPPHPIRNRMAPGHATQERKDQGSSGARFRAPIVDLERRLEELKQRTRLSGEIRREIETLETRARELQQQIFPTSRPGRRCCWRGTRPGPTRWTMSAASSPISARCMGIAVCG